MSRLELKDVVNLVQYLGHRNIDVMREFAKDIKKGKYDDRIIYSASTYVLDDDSTYLEVMVGSV